MIREFAGNTPCEAITGHDFSEWTRVTINRDVLILRALWTVGRSVVRDLPSDPTSHILADSLGWEQGEPAELASLPSWMRETRTDVSWPTVMLAARVAIAVRDQWAEDHVQHGRWQLIVKYLYLWSDRVH